MPIPHSPLNLAILRSLAFLIDSISPIAVCFSLHELYQLVTWTIDHQFQTPSVADASKFQWTLFEFLQLYLHLETMFFVYFHLQHKRLQRIIRPPPISDVDRERLLQQMLYTSGDEFHEFFAGWFRWTHTKKQVAPEEFHLIRRDNFRDWFAWMLFGASGYQELLNDPHALLRCQQLNEVVQRFSAVKNVFIQPGRNTDMEAIILNYNQVDAYLKPLGFYMVINLLETVGFSVLKLMGFRRVVRGRRTGSLDSGITYWVFKGRAGQTTEKKAPFPIVFFHGIGCGLFPYLHFVSQLLLKTNQPIFLVELPHVGMRLIEHVPTLQQLIDGVEGMLERHGCAEAVFVGHSLGSSLASAMVKYSKYVAGCVLLDPIVFLTHHPGLAWNFVHRVPGRNTETFRTNEFFIHWLVSRELYISYTISRHFIWHQIILWADDLPRNHHVVLSRQDLLLDAPVVEKYLANHSLNFTTFDVDHGAFLFEPSMQAQIVDRILLAANECS
ncbi:hypothetical protein BC830DRAFT_1131575 [Chytriomyces sp. MP71]|nr:hypothetical protein BC830DRAFT_1131575 [Chytriomyces sp. MP71]